MDVGVVTTHIAPAKGYGGVSVTADVLTRAWADLGLRIALVSSDESLGGPLKPEEVLLGEQVGIELYRCYGFRRWGFGFGAIPRLFRLCLKAPVIYIHGIATWPTTLAALFCVLLNKPFMVAAHGGLMPAHVALIKKRKPHKWLFYRWLTFPTLRRAIAVHCTSDTEAEGVRNVLGEDARILLVPNGIDCRAVQVAEFPDGPGMHLCFLGHIQREKGLNAFIRVWLKTREPNERLAVAGRSVDASYFEEFLRLVGQARGAISYRGYLDRSGVSALLASSHFLVLPSGLEETGGMRENFGNVVAEAMAAGRPVLAAKGLAWDHLQSRQAGFVFERNAQALAEALQNARNLKRAEWQKMSVHAREIVEKDLDSIALGQRVWRALKDGVPAGLEKPGVIV